MENNDLFRKMLDACVPLISAICKTFVRFNYDKMYYSKNFRNMLGYQNVLNCAKNIPNVRYLMSNGFQCAVSVIDQNIGKLGFDELFKLIITNEFIRLTVDTIAWCIKQGQIKIDSEDNKERIVQMMVNASCGVLTYDDAQSIISSAVYLRKLPPNIITELGFCGVNLDWLEYIKDVNLDVKDFRIFKVNNLIVFNPDQFYSTIKIYDAGNKEEIHVLRVLNSGSQNYDNSNQKKDKYKKKNKNMSNSKTMTFGSNESKKVKHKNKRNQSTSSSS